MILWYFEIRIHFEGSPTKYIQYIIYIIWYTVYVLSWWALVVNLDFKIPPNQASMIIWSPNGGLVVKSFYSNATTPIHCPRAWFYNISKISTLNISRCYIKLFYLKKMSMNDINRPLVTRVTRLSIEIRLSNKILASFNYW